MTPAELFGVVVRTIGLLGFLRGLWVLAFGVLTALGVFNPSKDYTWQDYLSGGVTTTLLGGAVLVGADVIVKSLYP